MQIAYTWESHFSWEVNVYGTKNFTVELPTGSSDLSAYFQPVAKFAIWVDLAGGASPFELVEKPKFLQDSQNNSNFLRMINDIAVSVFAKETAP